MCKQAKHATTYAAAQHILELKRKGKVSKKKTMGIYPCSECGGYHITSNLNNKLCIAKTR